MSIGSLYQYFPNKDAVLAETMRRIERQTQRAIAEALAAQRDAPLREVAQAFVDGLLGEALAPGARLRRSPSHMGVVCDTFAFPDDFRIDFPDNPTQFRDKLVEAFPNRAGAIDQYLRKVREVAGAMKPYYMARTLPPSVGGAAIGAVTDKLLARKAQSYLEQNTDAVLDTITDDPKLRSVLFTQWGYYGSLPSRSSFAIWPFSPSPPSSSFAG